MSSRVTAFALLLGSLAACSSEVQAPTETPPRTPVASITLEFSGPGPLYGTTPFAINDSGVVVGSAAVRPGDSPRAVMWRPPNDIAEFLPDQDSPNGSSANDIALDGVIGGQIGCTFVVSPCTPVFWRDGVLHVLDGVGRVNQVCPCDSHTLIGEILVNGALHGALWIDEVLIDVGTPAGFTNARLTSVAHGFIVGNAFNGTERNPTGQAAFRWAPSSGWTRLEGGSVVSAVNSRGTAVGYASGLALWLNGSNVATPLLDGSDATAINDSSVVAGTFRVADNYPFPTPGIWTQANGWTQIGIEMNATITDINNSNRVVGSWHDQGRDIGVIWP